jgi:flagellar protein FliO/FliZ
MGLSTIVLFLRLLLSLAVVVGLMWAGANLLRRRGFAPGGARTRGRGAQIELLSRRPLGRNASIAVVRIGERAMVVGVTDHQVTKLDDADVTEIDLDEAGTMWTVPPGASGPASAWKAMLEQLRNRTVRR